jgi:hypothetical protein
MDPQYAPPVGLPTSATRLHQANWSAQSQWPTDGPPPQMAYHHIPGGPNHAGYYHSSPYYRNGSMLHPSHQQVHSGIQHQAIQNGNTNENSSQQGPNSSRNGTPLHNGVGPQRDRNSNNQSTNVDTPHSLSSNPDVPVAPVIDPSLDAVQQVNTPETAGQHRNIHSPSSGDLDDVSLEITQAAMEALIKSATQSGAVVNRTSGSPEGPAVEGRGQANGRSPTRSQSNAEADEADADGDADGGDDELMYPDCSKRAQQTHGRPEPMDHMLTEDGEPMLNPG